MQVNKVNAAAMSVVNRQITRSHSCSLNTLHRTNERPPSGASLLQTSAAVVLNKFLVNNRQTDGLAKQRYQNCIRYDRPDTPYKRTVLHYVVLRGDLLTLQPVNEGSTAFSRPVAEIANESTSKPPKPHQGSWRFLSRCESF